jgi:ubiquinone/menaquinone biosynthesis C-methylase UbiE
MNLNQKLNPAYVNLVKFICMDARKMDFDDAKFDVVLDKGTLDCVLVISSVKIDR